MNVDAVLDEINGWGRYQKLMYLALCLPSIWAGAVVVSLSWTGYTMGYRCLVPACENASTATYDAAFLNFTSPLRPEPVDPDLPWDQCHTFHQTAGGCRPSSFAADSQVACGQWVYDTSVMDTSIVSQFELSCGRGWLPTLANSLYMGGMLLGSLLFGYISDRFGRKPAALLAFLLLGISGSAAAFSPNFGTFAAMRFLTGMGGIATFMLTFLLCVEMVSNDLRTFCGFAIELFFSFGEGMVGVLAIFVKDWWKLQLIVSTPIFIFLVYWTFVPESARWLAAQGRHNEAEKILRHAAKANGRAFPEHLLLLQDKTPADSPAAGPGSSASVAELFKSPALRWRTLVILLQWFVTAMVYYGLAMNATNLGGNVYVNFILVQIIDWPSIVFFIVVLDSWGRKLCSCLCFAIAGVGSIASGLASSGEGLDVLTVAFALVGKFGAAGMFSVVYVYGAELFPTDVRNSGIGLASAVGRVGSIAAPFIASLGTENQLAPMAIFGGLSLLAGLATLQLPETYGQNLPDTLKQAESFGRDQSLCFVPCVVRRRKIASSSSYPAATVC